jgi:hypothetical protein
MRRRSSLITRAALVSAAALLLSGLATGTGSVAGANPASLYQPKNVSVPYDQNWVFISKPLKTCMFIDIHGTLKAHHRNAYSAGSVPDPKWFLWSKLRMEKPLMTMRTGTIVHADGTTGCDLSRPIKLEHATLEQQWYEGGCHLGIAIAAGAPWSISVAPTYSCKTTKVADRAQPYDSGTKFAQHNTGYPVHYSGTVLAEHDDVLPVRGNLSVTGFRKVHGTQVSDTFHTGRALAFMDDCGGKCLTEK